MNNEGSCDCSLCIRSRRFREVLARVPYQDRNYWENMYDHLYHVEADLEYFKAVVKGNWPDADDVIKSHREKVVIDNE